MVSVHRLDSNENAGHDQAENDADADVNGDARVIVVAVISVVVRAAHPAANRVDDGRADHAAPESPVDAGRLVMAAVGTVGPLTCPTRAARRPVVVVIVVARPAARPI